ncbi:hypothetical protein SELMODRAFT_411497 [Selaginella moellendorffii]|uniref:Uncharacterized protein n=1 Tax=Selaginella moellendorffii TaxID=88036 RepID=D8RI47_SELML|nr:hypothetical protein SELMODRAFT_411497 [Selaginella moellendorffii]
MIAQQDGCEDNSQPSPNDRISLQKEHKPDTAVAITMIQVPWCEKVLKDKTEERDVWHFLAIIAINLYVSSLLYHSHNLLFPGLRNKISGWRSPRIRIQNHTFILRVKSDIPSKALAKPGDHHAPHSWIFGVHLGSEGRNIFQVINPGKTGQPRDLRDSLVEPIPVKAIEGEVFAEMLTHRVDSLAQWRTTAKTISITVKLAAAARLERVREAKLLHVGVGSKPIKVVNIEIGILLVVHPLRELLEGLTIVWRAIGAGHVVEQDMASSVCVQVVDSIGQAPDHGRNGDIDHVATSQRQPEVDIVTSNLDHARNAQVLEVELLDQKVGDDEPIAVASGGPSVGDAIGIHARESLPASLDVAVATIAERICELEVIYLTSDIEHWHKISGVLWTGAGALRNLECDTRFFFLRPMPWARRSSSITRSSSWYQASDMDTIRECGAARARISQTPRQARPMAAERGSLPSRDLHLRPDLQSPHLPREAHVLRGAARSDARFSSVDYSYEKTLDIICSCLGEKTLLTFHEFLGKNKTDIRLLCYMSGCYLDEDHEKKIKALGLSWSSKTDAWPEEASLKGYPSHPRASEFVATFSCEVEVLGIGDVFYSDVESELVAQIAICISRKIQEAKPRVIYISTDAAESEITLLQQLLGPDVPMIQRPQHDSREKWDAILQRKGLLADNEVVAGSDAAQNGTPGSTFTDDILRLRKEWGKYSFQGLSLVHELCRGGAQYFVGKNCEQKMKVGEQVAKAFKEHKETFLRLDVCVNCAGIVEQGDFVSDDKWCKVLRVNLMAAIECTSQAIQAMRSQDSPGGAIVNLASAGRLFLVPLYPTYSASKERRHMSKRSVSLGLEFILFTFFCRIISELLLMFQYVETPMTAKEMIAATIPMKNPVHGSGFRWTLQAGRNESPGDVIWKEWHGVWMSSSVSSSLPDLARTSRTLLSLTGLNAMPWTHDTR